MCGSSVTSAGKVVFLQSWIVASSWKMQENCLLPDPSIHLSSSSLPLSPVELFSIAEIAAGWMCQLCWLHSIFSLSLPFTQKHSSQLSCVNLRFCETASLPKEIDTHTHAHAQKRVHVANRSTCTFCPEFEATSPNYFAYFGGST